MTTTHIGDDVEDGRGKLALFIRRLSNASAAVAAKRARGASTSGQMDGVIRQGDEGERLVPKYARLYLTHCRLIYADFL